MFIQKNVFINTLPVTVPGHYVSLRIYHIYGSNLLKRGMASN